jgi:hypothetical protein
MRPTWTAQSRVRLARVSALAHSGSGSALGIVLPAYFEAPLQLFGCGPFLFFASFATDRTQGAWG